MSVEYSLWFGTMLSFLSIGFLNISPRCKSDLLPHFIGEETEFQAQVLAQGPQPVRGRGKSQTTRVSQQQKLWSPSNLSGQPWVNVNGGTYLEVATSSEQHFFWYGFLDQDYFLNAIDCFS